MRKYQRLVPLAIGLYCTGTTGNVLAASDQSTPSSIHANKQKDKAQSTAPAAPSSTDTATPSNNQAAELQKVTVTGQAISAYQVPETSTALGTDTSVLDTPFSVTPIPKKLLNDQGAQSLEQAVRNTPGVSIGLGEGNRDQLIIRGVNTKSDFFMNGMRDDSEYFRPLYNVEHIDVLKGPAALQFGRGGAGGIVNFVTKKAERRNIRSLMVEGGGGEAGSSWGHFRGWADLGTAIGDSGAVRLNAMGEDSGGFREHYFLHRYAVNPTFHFDLGDRTKIDLSLSYLNDHRFADRGIPSQNGRPVNVNRSQFFGSVDQNRFYSDVTTGQLEITHEVNNHLKLRNNFRTFQNTRRYTNFYPASAVGEDGTFLFKAYDHPSERLSYQERIEAIADFDTGIVSHKVLGGAGYTWQRDQDIQFLPGESKTIKGVFHTLDDTEVAPMAMTTLDRHNNVHADEIGVFLQDQISLGEHWIALAGVRYDRFSTDAQYLKSGTSTQRVDNTWSPRAALMYKPVKNDTMYFSYSRNYTPSGANVALSLKSPDGANLAPERSDQYEFGNKLDLFDGNLLLGIAFFQIDLTNIPASDPSGGSEMVSIGRQRNRGIELSTNGSVTDKWNIFSNYTYIMDARNLVAVEDTAAGATVGLVPRNQFSVWSTYDLNEHWGFGAGVRGESSKYTSFTNTVKLPAYVVGDLMAYYQMKKFRFQINFNNVSDETYYATASGDNQIMPGTPRSVFARVNVDL